MFKYKLTDSTKKGNQFLLKPCKSQNKKIPISCQILNNGEWKKTNVYQCRAFVKMQTSYIKAKPLQGLMPVLNKRALTLNAPKVSECKRSPDGPALHLSADRWVLTLQPLKLQMVPSYGGAVYIFTPLSLSQGPFMCEGYEAKWIMRAILAGTMMGCTKSWCVFCFQKCFFILENYQIRQ